MTKRVCKISHLNCERLLGKLQKILGSYFVLPHPVYIRYRETAHSLSAFV